MNPDLRQTDVENALAARLEAAAALLTNPAAGANDRGLLRYLGYDDGDAAKTVGRARILRAAARLKRLFLLSAPDAPGLVFFGGEADPRVLGLEPSIHRKEALCVGKASFRRTKPDSLVRRSRGARAAGEHERKSDDRDTRSEHLVRTSTPGCCSGGRVLVRSRASLSPSRRSRARCARGAMRSASTAESSAPSERWSFAGGAGWCSTSIGATPTAERCAAHEGIPR